MKRKKITNIYELIDDDQFRKIPQLYLGEKSISRLMLFMIGYEVCETFNNINSDTKPSFVLFFPWICKYYNYCGSSRWDGIILQNCDNDEEKALNTFFKRFDEFKAYKPINILKAEIRKTELDFFSTYEGKNCLLKDGDKIIEEPVDIIYVIKYSNDFGVSIHYGKNGEKFHYGFKRTIKTAKDEATMKYGHKLEWHEISENAINDIYEKIN